MQPSRAALALAISLVSLLAAGAARADAVDGPPKDCPPGSVGETSHGGPYCYPTVCDTDADCATKEYAQDVKTPRKCVEQPLCVVTEPEIGYAGRRTGTRENAKSTCAAGAACAQPGATCAVAKRCVATSPLARAGCGKGCALADGGDATFAPLAALAALAVAWRRRASSVRVRGGRNRI